MWDGLAGQGVDHHPALLDFPVADQQRFIHEGLVLVKGEPMVYGADSDKGIVAGPTGALELISGDDVAERSLVHDPSMDDSTRAFALSRLQRNGGPLPIGILRQVERPVYEQELLRQVEQVESREGDGELEALLTGGTTWNVEG